MRTCSGEEIAQNLHGLVCSIGYPYGLLSRISPRCIKEEHHQTCLVLEEVLKFYSQLKQ